MVDYLIFLVEREREVDIRRRRQRWTHIDIHMHTQTCAHCADTTIDKGGNRSKDTQTDSDRQTEIDIYQQTETDRDRQTDRYRQGDRQRRVPLPAEDGSVAWAMHRRPPWLLQLRLILLQVS